MIDKISSPLIYTLSVSRGKKMQQRIALLPFTVAKHSIPQLKIKS